MSWPDPEFSRHLAGWRKHAARERKIITGMAWDPGIKHLSVSLAPRPKAEQIEAREPSPRSAGQGRLL